MTAAGSGQSTYHPCESTASATVAPTYAFISRHFASKTALRRAPGRSLGSTTSFPQSPGEHMPSKDCEERLRPWYLRQPYCTRRDCTVRTHRRDISQTATTTSDSRDVPVSHLRRTWSDTRTYTQVAVSESVSYAHSRLCSDGMARNQDIRLPNHMNHHDLCDPRQMVSKRPSRHLVRPARSSF